MTKMHTYFVRHNRGIDIDDQTRRRLWEARRIAIHYPWEISGDKTRDSSSLNPDSYQGTAKSAMRTIVALSEKGGYVCAEHHGHPDWMLGFIPPKSKISLLKGKWGDKYGRSGRTAILKTLRLTRIRLVQPLDYAVLAVGRPRQGTIMRWNLRGPRSKTLSTEGTWNHSYPICRLANRRFSAVSFFECPM